MEIENDIIVRGHIDNPVNVSPELQAYNDAKMRAAERREQDLLEKPFLIEKIINKIKYKFKYR